MARKSHRRGFAPRLETCEARTLMTGYSGINIGGNGLLSTSNMWVDLAKKFGAWGEPTAPWTANPSLTLSAQGYPLSDAASNTSTVGIPNGIYNLSYQGSATVYVWAGGTLVGTPVTGADGVTRAQVTLTPAGGNSLNLRFSNINAANPPHDLHIIEPGYDVNTTQVYTNDFLHTLQPFTALRFMEFTSTNYNPDVNWSDRTQPDNFFQTGPKGVAYEYVAAMANAAHKDVWINVPAQATDDFVKNLADLLRDQVHSDAKIYVEFGNEDWNSSFSQYYQIRTMANANPLITGTTDWTRIAQESAFREKQIGDIFRQEFGTRSAQVKPILGAFQSGTSFGQAGLSFVNSLYGDPSQYFAGMAVGTYFVTNLDMNVSGVTLNQLFASLSSNIAGGLTNSIQANKVVADTYHLPLMSYEGGLALVSANHVEQPLIDQAQDDPRMGNMNRQFVTAWDRYSGGGLGCYYKLIAPNSWSGDWGLLNISTEIGSPKFDAMMGVLLPGGDATLDGTVGYDDFLILKNNFNQPGKFWWEQGDFNHDGVVNAADLLILKANLGPVTSAQAAEIAAFGAQNPAAAVSFVGTDTTSQGNWKPTYGSDGWDIPSDASSNNPKIPSYASVSLSGISTYTWAASTAQIRAPQKSATGSTDRVAGVWYAANSESIDIHLSDGNSHQIAIYALDWDYNNARAERVDVIDDATGALIDTRDISSFQNGVYLAWNVKGNVTLKVTNTSGASGNAVISGLFFGTANSPLTPAATASFIQTDTTSQGNWKSTYGGDGWDIKADGSSNNPSIPSYATVAISGASPYTWASSTTQTRALQKSAAGSTGRVAGTWYAANSENVDIHLNDGNVHQIAIYALDWDYNGVRAERVDVIDDATGLVIDTRNVSSFQNGAYLVWNVKGNVTLKVTNTAGSSGNAVISGLFFGKAV